MSKLDEFLGSLNKTAQVEKTAEELHMEKLANQNETIEDSTALGLIGEELCKEASEDNILHSCGLTLIDASQAMTLGLQKVAAENVEGMIVDMVDTQQSLYKVGEVMATIANKANDEEFTKMASAVVEINNKLFDELAELAGKDENVANYLADYHVKMAEEAGKNFDIDTFEKDAGFKLNPEQKEKLLARLANMKKAVMGAGRKTIETGRLQGAALAAHIAAHKTPYIAVPAAAMAGGAGYLAGRKNK